MIDTINYKLEIFDGKKNVGNAFFPSRESMREYELYAPDYLRFQRMIRVNMPNGDSKWLEIE